MRISWWDRTGNPGQFGSFGVETPEPYTPRKEKGKRKKEKGKRKKEKGRREREKGKGRRERVEGVRR
jgi:hypothetical protein